MFSSLTFILVLGWNPGTYMQYIYQIMLPPFFLLLFQSIKPSTRLTLISFSLLLLNMILFSQLRFNPAFLQQKGLKELGQVISIHRECKTYFEQPCYYFRDDRAWDSAVDSGQTEIYYYIGSYPDNILLGPNYQVLKSTGGQYRNSIRHNVIDAKYDEIFLTKGSGFPLLVPDAISSPLFSDRYHYRWYAPSRSKLDGGDLGTYNQMKHSNAKRYNDNCVSLVRVRAQHTP